MVLEIDSAKGRVSLGLKQTQRNTDDLAPDDLLSQAATVRAYIGFRTLQRTRGDTSHALPVCRSQWQSTRLRETSF